MKYITSRTTCLAFGLPFVVLGIVGFFPNPLISHQGVFEVNVAHNVLHVVVGAIFLAGVPRSNDAARRTLQSLSVAGILLAVLGFLANGSLILGLIHVNEADKWLHAVLAVVLVAIAVGISMIEGRRKAPATSRCKKEPCICKCRHKRYK